MPTSPAFPVLPADAAGLKDWLRPVETRVFVERAHGQWYATIERYSLTGIGPSPELAITDAFGLLGPYLYSEFADGKAWDDAVRPVSARTRVEFRVKHIASRARSRVLHRRRAIAQEFDRRIEPAELCF